MGLCSLRRSISCATPSKLCDAHVKQVKARLVETSPPELLQVVLRRGLQDDPDDVAGMDQRCEWFIWRWDQLLVRVAGSNAWGQGKRHYSLISSGHPPDDPKKKCITSSHEAFVELCCENCGQRFPCIAEKVMANLPINKTTDGHQSKCTTSCC